MKILKRIFLTLIIIIIIVAVGVFAYQKIQKQRMVKAVKDGLVVIDQESHYWNISKKGEPISIELYIRNKSEHKIVGNLVFLVTLSHKGVEKEFIISALEVYGGEDELRNYINKKAKEGRPVNVRLKAFLNYISRGKKLPKGMNYEPLPTEDNKDEKDYVFKFRKYVSLSSGEVTKIECEEEIPLNEKGFLLDVKIESIEF